MDWRDIPVFIVNRNRLQALQRLVQWLLDAGTRRVVILDNASNYPPLLQWYQALPPGVNTLLLPDNHGPYVLWQQGVHRVLDTPYVLTDSDVVPASFCPADLIGALLAHLQRFPDAKKVGPALRIDNLPEHYAEVDTVRKWESQFWERPVAPGVFAAPIDTTFALYPPRAEFSNEPCNLRLGRPYIVEHTPWYVDEAALDDEERHYRANTSVVHSNWSVPQKESWVKKSARVAAFEQRARVLHLDGGRDTIFGWINASAAGQHDLAFDVAAARRQHLALADDSIDGIHLSHVLADVRDAQPLFDELWRVARPGATLFLRVAHGALGSATPPARAWYEGSFAHLARPTAGAQGMGDWQLERVGVIEDDQGAPQEVVATLTAVKPARATGTLHPAPQPPLQRLRDSRVAPSFERRAPAAAVPAAARPRLGLPWRMAHYRPLNGPHPLVLSFLQGNDAIDAIDLAGDTALQPQADAAIEQRIALQAAALPPAQAASLKQWLPLREQDAAEVQAARYDALFLHTTPLYAGSRRWIFHFESFPSLFMPFMFTGATRAVDLTSQSFFALVRQQLESPQCLRIFSHMRGSLAVAARAFGSAAITAKLHHVPLGIDVVEHDRWAAKFRTEQPLRILFTNSLHHNPDSFYLRGGHHLLEAFAMLRRQRPDAELTVLSSTPADLMRRFTPQDLIGVNWISKRVDDATLDALFEQHQVFALPAAGLHSHSLLRALAHGCVPIVSDAPGYEEYTAGIEASVLAVQGVRALVYRDEPGGWISDRYAPFIDRNEPLVRQIHDILRTRTDLAELHEHARRNAAHCAAHFTPAASHAAFNRMLASN
jgi:glycosyltransferase involved in cell wall biosynthesis/SAM-dependent methyltransferase